MTWKPCYQGEQANINIIVAWAESALVQVSQSLSSFRCFIFLSFCLFVLFVLLSFILHLLVFCLFVSLYVVSLSFIFLCNCFLSFYILSFVFCLLSFGFSFIVLHFLSLILRYVVFCLSYFFFFLSFVFCLFDLFVFHLMLQVARMINVSSHAEIREGIAELQAAQVPISKYFQTFSPILCILAHNS